MLPGRDSWNVGPKLASTMSSVIREEVLAIGLVQKMEGNHSCPRVRDGCVARNSHRNRYYRFEIVLTFQCQLSTLHSRGYSRKSIDCIQKIHRLHQV